MIMAYIANIGQQYDSISLDEDGGEKMPVIDTSKLSDAQTVAEKLTGLPKEALLYIAGYAEGCRDKPKRRKKPREHTNGENEARP